MKVFQIDSDNTLSLSLFIDVSNSKELLDSMQLGTLDPEASNTAHKALQSKARDSITTRTLHSELVYNYSGSKHITESLKRCGISDNSTYILAARFNASSNEMTAIIDLVKGKEVDIEDLAGRANEALIQKHYKIPGLELGLGSLADAIACRIAARDAL